MIRNIPFIFEKLNFFKKIQTIIRQKNPISVTQESKYIIFLFIVYRKKNMPKKTATQSFSDSFWSDSPESHVFSSPSSLSLNHKKKVQSQQDFLSSVDDSPEFHDPYSDLSLFLSNVIKKEMESINTPSHWTLKVQEELLSKITPEFQKKFPQYRLGVSAVKKIWGKILFYTEQVKGKKEAVDSNGKLNIQFFIKENLRQYFQQKAVSFLTPYQCAYQIASKMSECIATLEGSKPKLDFLTHIIWSLQKHLLKSSPLKQSKTPYDEFDKVDKLIVKTILETTAKHPHISLEELESKTKETLQSLHDLPDFSSIDKVVCNVSSILSEKLYSASSFHFSLFAEQKEAAFHFIRRHSALYKKGSAMPDLPALVRRIIALYSLASQMPKDVPAPAFYETVASFQDPSIKRPEIHQSVCAFISAELLLLKSVSPSASLEEQQKTLLEAYRNTSALPTFQQMNKEHLEIITWKLLSETEGFLEKLPYRIGQRIEEEIAAILIDNPEKSFSSIVHDTVQFFKQVKELTETKKWQEAPRKIHLWCIQNDMLCRSVKLNTESPLARLISEKFLAKKRANLCHSALISEVCQEFLKQFPSATIYLAQLSSKAWTLYKYMWFTTFSKEEESSLDRFLKWHIQFLSISGASQEEVLLQLEEICKKCLPLIPFDPKQALTALSDS